MKVSDLTAQDLFKTKGIITFPKDASLAQALLELNSSHDAAFVVEEQKLLGVINPYYVLFHSKFPPKTKLEHCLFHTPKLTMATPLSEIAALMVESKIYFLPVFENGDKWTGIVTRNRILEALATTKFLPQLNRIRQPKKLVTVNDEISIGQARKLMQQGGVSRLLVVDKENNLTGILTRYDLRIPYASPTESVPQFALIGQKTSNSADPIKPYVKKDVVTLPQLSSAEEIIKLLYRKEVGSVVLIDAENHPTGFVSTKDVLQILAELDDQIIEDVHISSTNGFLVTPLFKQLLTQSLDKLKRHHEIRHLDVTVKVERNATGLIARHTITLKADRPHGGLIVAKTEHQEWHKALSEALHKLKSQATSK